MAQRIASQDPLSPDGQAPTIVDEPRKAQSGKIPIRLSRECLRVEGPALLPTPPKSLYTLPRLRKRPSTAHLRRYQDLQRQLVPLHPLRHFHALCLLLLQPLLDDDQRVCGEGDQLTRDRLDETPPRYLPLRCGPRHQRYGPVGGGPT
jgi:hypothetical protein